MGYDLHLLDPQPGIDPLELLEQLEESQPDGPPDPPVAARNRRLADALVRLNPSYSEFHFDHEAIALETGVSVEQARLEYRHIELTDERGLQITLFDSHASIGFPYWDSLDPDFLLGQIDAATRIIGGETSWRLYDPQLERWLDPQADAEDFRRAFEQGREQVRRIAEEHAGGGPPQPPPGGGGPQPPPRRPFWRKLLGGD